MAPVTLYVLHFLITQFLYRATLPGIQVDVHHVQSYIHGMAVSHPRRAPYTETASHIIIPVTISEVIRFAAAQYHRTCKDALFYTPTAAVAIRPHYDARTETRYLSQFHRRSVIRPRLFRIEIVEVLIDAIRRTPVTIQDQEAHLLLWHYLIIIKLNNIYILMKGH